MDFIHCVFYLLSSPLPSSESSTTCCKDSCISNALRLTYVNRTKFFCMEQQVLLVVHKHFVFFFVAVISFVFLSNRLCLRVHASSLFVFDLLIFLLFAWVILKNFTEWCLSAVQRFGKFLQELSSKLPPLRARSFKIEDVRKYLDRHHRYLYHCHRQQFGYEVSVEVMEEAQFPVSTNRCRSMRSLTIAETRPGA